METESDKNPKKVLWVIDLTSHPREVFRGVESFKTDGSEVHILYMGEDTAHHPAWYGEFTPEHAKRIEKKEMALADKHLNKICEKYLDGCKLYVRHFDVGDPTEKVLALTQEEAFDLVIMPSQLVSQYADYEDSVTQIKAMGDIEVRVA